MADLLIDLFKAYYSARSNKRNTYNALKFELYHEHNLIELYDEIINRSYEPRPSICFIVNKPVKREVFAASFRDRIIHHLIFNYIAPVFENRFINDSYSCRKGKGTHYGLQGSFAVITSRFFFIGVWQRKSVAKRNPMKAGDFFLKKLQKANALLIKLYAKVTL